ncbi:ChrR family anti-sigma-E factor [uncultured Shimia sp.]|uniref:ChrR family anti-sigma-E factor n=1 Tax=uncultured Shimia sp. TaxID=573152 RepID=UPI002633D01F|nr:ChrR family anti-sigma-E factor [uncultured Shimia sp.]
MSSIRHHIPESLLASYASGELSYAFSMVVAAHVSMCAECRARLVTHETVGGVLLDEEHHSTVTSGLRSRVLDMLDTPQPVRPAPRRMGVFPGPVAEALSYGEPKWRRLGAGVRQTVLKRSDEESVRLLYIPAGQAVPDHGHNGLELTLVLQGAFSDETGTFGVGDVEVADDELEHTPVAAEGDACICLAATDAQLKFNAFVPRLLQPVLGI